MITAHLIAPRFRFLLAVAALAAASACASAARDVPAGTVQPDKFLFDRGTEELDKRKWLTAREFFRQILDTYVQSPYRPDAKLGVGDTYLGEGTPEALERALNEFREFLNFFPTNPRADYAQYKLGMTHFRQMRAPQRDQTETREAIREFETFVARYPNSTLMEEAKARLRALTPAGYSGLASELVDFLTVERKRDGLRAGAFAGNLVGGRGVRDAGLAIAFGAAAGRALGVVAVADRCRSVCLAHRVTTGREACRDRRGNT